MHQTYAASSDITKSVVTNLFCFYCKDGNISTNLIRNLEVILKFDNLRVQYYFFIYMFTKDFQDNAY